MAGRTQVELGDHFDGFVAQQIESGRYDSPSEVVRAGLSLLEDTEQRRNMLQQMLEAGERSGEAEYTLSSFIETLDKVGR